MSGVVRKTRQKRVRPILFVSVIFVVLVTLAALAAKGGGFGRAAGSWRPARFVQAYPVVSIPGEEAGNGRA